MINDRSNPIIFQPSSLVPFSALTAGFTLQWSAWEPRALEVTLDGVLCYRKHRASPILGKLSLMDVRVKVLALNENIYNPLVTRESGIIVMCKTLDGADTYFRCILAEYDLNKFFDTIRKISKDHNLQYAISKKSITKEINSRIGVQAMQNLSVMRRAIFQAIDDVEMRDRKQMIKQRRGSMTCLPVYFMNDLIHGAWWFVLGSLVFLGHSVAMYVNSFTYMVGEDDSVLSKFHYRAIWLMMIFSSFFFTLGSFAFLRAVHEDPPMKALFPGITHMQSDELLGSWLFLIATVPLIPFSLIYLSESDDIEFFGGLVVSCLFVLGSMLFVRACYPESEVPRQPMMRPLMKTLCCICCSRKWMEKHFSNDWLCGCWFVYWATLASFVFSAVLLFLAVSEDNNIGMFIYSIGTLENGCFLLGALYFIAGSYYREDPLYGSVLGDAEHVSNPMQARREEEEFYKDSPTKARLEKWVDPPLDPSEGTSEVGQIVAETTPGQSTPLYSPVKTEEGPAGDEKGKSKSKFGWSKKGPKDLQEPFIDAEDDGLPL